MREEVIIAGHGGQGILFMGAMLANAAMVEGLDVTFFPSYGAEMRGGTASGGLVISDKKIGSPVVTKPSSLIIMNEFALEKFYYTLHDKGIVIINSSLISRMPKRDNIKVVKIPATQFAEVLGDIRVANMIALGSYIKETGIVSLESAIKSLYALLKGTKRALIDINEKALKLGTSDEY